MAAPKQNSPVQATQSSTLKAAPHDPPTVKDPSSDPPPTPHKAAASTYSTLPKESPATEDAEVVDDFPELTYAGTESSDAYLSAKNLLNSGDFDQALETIGTAMANTLSRLPEESGTLHESMGPYYYLYGTTLLYSIEECSDNIGPDETSGEEADDIQIAWENLETSRHIVSKMRETTPGDHLTIDLAQIHMRLGDVQKANDRSVEALEDYRKALELSQPLLGMYNRKVADLYMLSAMVYMTMASAEGVTNELKDDYIGKALEHYLACGKSLAGLIAFTCGHDPEVVTKDPDTISGGGKTSGLTESELKVDQMSLTLNCIRKRVATMGEKDDQVQEWKDILTEIQETIDEAEQASKAMAEVTEMKIQAIAAAEGEGEIQNLDGSTTALGFGGAVAASASVTRLNVTSTSSGDKPMMVVRKKKKLDAPEHDQKISAEEDPIKRAKIE